MSRTFEDKEAVRSSVPLMIGLTGASGSGKTYSALRLATGIQSVTGGDVFFIDTESRRALHYAEAFRFRHVEFGAPFSPLDYLSAIEHCVKRGAKTIIVDSMSHEHEGPGGVLEMHDEEVQKRSGGDWKRANAITFACWAEPKAQRRRLINSILQLGVNMIACFRAKEKVRLPSASEKEHGQREPIQMGWMPIAGEEFVYEMTANCLLMPGSSGVPTWHPENPGERQMTKKPSQFASILTDGAQLDEAMGEKMARWAAGVPDPIEAMILRIASADGAALELIRTEMSAAKQSGAIPKRDLARIGVAWTARFDKVSEERMREPGDD